MKTTYENTPVEQASIYNDLAFRLSIAEQRNPIGLFIHFINTYNLVEVRHLLERWALLAIKNREADVHKDFSFAHDLEKIIEALYMIIIKKGIFSVIPFYEDVTSSRYKKTLFFLDAVRANPLQGLSRIFQMTENDHLKIELEHWSKICIENTSYIEMSEGADVVDHYAFCKEMQKLIEALYVLCAAYCKSNGDEALLLNRENDHIRKHEQQNPYLVLQYFRATIPYRYAVAEIWDIADGVVKNQHLIATGSEETLNRLEAFLSIIESAFLIVKENSELLNIIKELRVKEDSP